MIRFTGNIIDQWVRSTDCATASPPPPSQKGSRRKLERGDRKGGREGRQRGERREREGRERRKRGERGEKEVREGRERGERARTRCQTLTRPLSMWSQALATVTVVGRSDRNIFFDFALKTSASAGERDTKADLR